MVWDFLRLPNSCAHPHNLDSLTDNFPPASMNGSRGFFLAVFFMQTRKIKNPSLCQVDLAVCPEAVWSEAIWSEAVCFEPVRTQTLVNPSRDLF